MQRLGITVQAKCQIPIYRVAVRDATQIVVYFWSVKACCFEISVNVYMHVCVGWRGYDVKGERSAVTAGNTWRVEQGKKERNMFAHCREQDVKM